jgi:hypothetical protein
MLGVAAIISLAASIWAGVFAVFPVMLVALAIDYGIGGGK